MRSLCLSKHSKAKKRDISPSSGPIWTIPMPQSHLYRFLAVGTLEEVGGTTTRGERVWGSIRDGRAIFLMSLAAMAVRKTVVDGWTG
jgi:hypothetical protein